MKALWRGEVVTVVSVKGGKVQIARACGLRWVRPSELTKAYRKEAYVRDVERLSVERALECLEGL